MQKDGKAETYALAGQTYIKEDGSEAILYPADTYAAGKSFDCDGLREGDWYLPSLSELVTICKDVRYPAIYNDGKSTDTNRDADVLNEALQKIGGTAIQNNNLAWSSSRYLSNVSWFFHGSYGYCNLSSFYYSLRCYPCVLCMLP